MMSAPASPCVSICKMDRGSGLCIGCWRTLNEIAAWSALDDAQRRRVLQDIAARRVAARAERGLGRE
jgi:predicted Fe-S protein YdhL (DUF1289 family)